MTRRSVATAVAAVLGIVVSAALAWTASQLAGQRVGLSSEPLSVATGLAPPVHTAAPHVRPHRGDDRPARRAAPAGTTTTTTVTLPTSPPTGATQPASPPATSAAQPVTGGGSVTTASGGASRGPAHRGDGGDRHDD